MQQHEFRRYQMWWNLASSMFGATIVTPSMMKRCRLASFVLSELSVFVQCGEEVRRRGEMTQLDYLLANENMGNSCRRQAVRFARTCTRTEATSYE